jgi:nicotinate-nucleotide adenylyltransferase
MGVTGLFGGTFDPPHNGHVALLEGAERHFRFDRLLVLVAADPGHRTTHASPPDRVALARAAFPGREVELDEHGRTVDLLRARKLEDPLFLIGADEFGDFSSWKEPEKVLELARLGVASRPGYAVESVISAPGRVIPFEIEAVPVSSTEIRRRVAAGEPIDGLVPPAVAAEIERLGLYRGGEGSG